LKPCKKEWKPKQVILASNYTRLEAMADVLSSPLEKIWMIFAIAIRKFWSRGMFFDTQAFPKNWGNMLTIKIGRVVILSVRPDKLISQTG
jgi:hypothetical protein